MNLSEELLHGIYSYGFEQPSIIQQRAIVPMVQGKDIVAQAQSGTGKTSNFFYLYIANERIQKNLNVRQLYYHIQKNLLHRHLQLLVR